MFSKKCKLKSSNALKTSTRKSLAQKLKDTYPIVTEDDLLLIFPLKGNLTLCKITTHSDELITVYLVDSVPTIIEMNEIFCPTIFALWKCPHMVPSITVNDYLGKRLQEGIAHIKRSHLPPYGSAFPRFKKGAVLCVNTTDNFAPISVGLAQYVSSEMLIVQEGTCIKTLNILGDFLCCNEKFTKSERPLIPFPLEIPIAIEENLSMLKIDSDEAKNEITSDANQNPDNLSNDDNNTNDEATAITSSDYYPDDMDSLLEYCLLCVLKVKGKSIELPLKVNLLYANNMASFCPSTKTLDVKKSSYKKMSRFLDAMQKDNILEVKEIEKGVDAVVSINFAHELIKSHTVIKEPPIIEVSSKKGNDCNYQAPEVSEAYKVTAAVVILLNSKKGSLLNVSKVREAVVNYIKKNELQDPQNKSVVKIDPILGTITSSNPTVSWDKLMSEVLNKMTHCTIIKHPDGKTSILTGKLNQISMNVVNKMGKKVTIISNLDVYGINLNVLSKGLKQAAAASCTVKKSLDGKKDELYVQGDQTYNVAKYLTEIYNMPKKFIQSADKMLIKKNK